MTTLPTWPAPFASSRAGAPVPRGTGFGWRSMVRRGLGQDPTETGVWYNPDPSTTTPSSPQAASPGINWTPIITALATAGGQIGKTFASYANPIYNLAPGTYYSQTPYGTTVSTAGIPGSVATSLTASNMMPILLIGGGLLLVMMMAKK